MAPTTQRFAPDTSAPAELIALARGVADDLEWYSYRPRPSRTAARNDCDSSGADLWVLGELDARIAAAGLERSGRCGHPAVVAALRLEVVSPPTGEPPSSADGYIDLLACVAAAAPERVEQNLAMWVSDVDGTVTELAAWRSRAGDEILAGFVADIAELLRRAVALGAVEGLAAALTEVGPPRIGAHSFRRRTRIAAAA